MKTHIDGMSDGADYVRRLLRVDSGRVSIQQDLIRPLQQISHGAV